jgi:hypothetical protein
MLVRYWRFFTLLLTALALTMTSAHVLELPQKLAYGPALYAAVNTTMYRYFALVGGVYTVGSLVAVLVLAVLVRHRSDALRWTAAGLLGLSLALVSWLALVEPVNREVAAALIAAPESVPALWQSLRERWEFGHATGFVLQLLGFAALLASVLVDTPGTAVDPARADSSRIRQAAVSIG